MTDSPKLGDLWRYPFLWSAEAARGETEGRKSRPVSLMFLSQRRDGEVEVFFLPVTTKNPGRHDYAVEVPEIEKRRAGLDLSTQLWVIANEVNSDVLSESFYFEPDGRLGSFSMAFVKRVQGVMIKALKSKNLRAVKRWEPPAD